MSDHDPVMARVRMHVSQSLQIKSDGEGTRFTDW